MGPDITIKPDQADILIISCPTISLSHSTIGMKKGKKRVELRSWTKMCFFLSQLGVRSSRNQIGNHF